MLDMDSLDLDRLEGFAHQLPLDLGERPSLARSTASLVMPRRYVSARRT